MKKKTKVKIEEQTPHFSQDYYNKDYFVTPQGKKFSAPDGKVYGWSYENPIGEFAGAGPICQAWKTMFEPENMLDIGCGRGTFVAYARDCEIDAEGFDFSSFAVSDEGRYPRCKKEWVQQHDATKKWPYPDNHFDLVTCLDLFEHIYEEDLPMVIDEMFRVAKKWIFIQICTIKGQVGYSFKKGQQIPVELEGMAVAGHVTIKPEYWWNYRFYRTEWLSRLYMIDRFVSLVDRDIISNWLNNTIIILEKNSENKK